MDMRLSLLSFSSFLSFALSLSDSFGLLLSISLIMGWLFSICKLFLELDPLSREGKPNDNIDDFLWEPGVVGERVCELLPGVR